MAHPEIWSATLAVFGVRAAVPAGLAVTPDGSEHDLRFTRSWQLPAADADLLREYDEVKLGAIDLDEATYEDRKSAFFDRLLALWPTHPAGGA